MITYKLKTPTAALVAKLFICACFMLSACQVKARSGHCDTDNPVYYTFNYNPTLASPDQNKAGLEFPSIYNWNLGGMATAVCDSDIAGFTFYFKGTSNGAAEGHAPGWFVLNDNLEYKAEVGIYNQSTESTDFKQVPFTNVQNNVGHNSYIYLRDTEFYSGSVGHLSLYFRRPFVGQLVIPTTIITKVYATTIFNNYGTKPVSIVQMSGTVTVPQSCNINEGDVINVDFGNIAENNFSTKGQPPTGFDKKRLDLSIKCSNISNGVDVSLEFNGTLDSNDPTAVKTDNDDIGVRLATTTNSTISPNRGEIPVNFNYSSQTGTSSMQLYPINTTGNIPKSGKFNSQVTVTVDIQ